MNNKKKLLQINIEVNSGSTGRIAEQIGIVAKDNDFESFITYARGYNKSKSKTIKIGNRFNIFIHVLRTRFLGNHLFGSKLATWLLINRIKKINPDIIHLHQIHGYYLHVPLLFKFLNSFGKPIVWTLHDCWAFTGHCTHFVIEKCDKWKIECNNCPKISNYPSSLYFDKSKESFTLKKEQFTLKLNIKYVGVSNWIKDLAKQSFLKNNEIFSIFNGVNLKQFWQDLDHNLICEKYQIDKNKKIILAVGTEWSERKGILDYFKLGSILNNNYQLLLVGLDQKTIEILPNSIKGVSRTENIDDLRKFYSVSSVLLCLSYQESFGLTPIEAMACGTPSIVYDNTALSELVTSETGLKVETGNLSGIVEAINEILNNGKEYYSENCIKRATEIYDIEKTYINYIDLYNKLLK